MGLLLVPSQFNVQPAFPTGFSNSRWNPVVCINPSLPLELINGGATVTPGSVYAPNPFGVARAPTSAYVSEDYVVSVPALVDFTTYLYVYYYTAVTGGYVYMTGNGSGVFAICGTHPSTSGNWGMYCGSSFISSGEVMPQKQWTLLTITRTAGTMRLYRDGVLKNTVSNSTTVSAFTRFTFNSYITSGGYGADTGTQYGLAGIDTVAWSADEIAAVSSNPWSIFQAPDEEIWINAGSGGTTYNQSVSGSLTASGNLLKRTSKFFSGSSTAAGALTKQCAKQLAGSCTYAGSIVKKTAKSYTGSLTTSGSLNKLTTHSFAGSITPSGTLATMILFTCAIAGSLTASGALQKMTLKALAGASTISGALTKLTSKNLSASITLSGLLNKLTKKAFSGSVTATGTLTEAYSVLKSLAGSIKPTGVVTAVYIAFVAGVLKLLALMGVGQ